MTEQNVRQAKRGKPVHPIWSDSFDVPDVHCIQSPNNALCKHCKQSVRHHHKTLSVETHLRKCQPFKNIMMDKPVRDRPDWWNNGVNGAYKKAKVATSSSSKSVSSFGNLTQSSLRSFAIPHLNATEQKKFNQEIAMHFYCTGTSFVRVEDPYLLRAMQLLRPGTRLPTRKQLADDSSGGLLESCYQRVKAEVGKLLSLNKQYICITSDAWSSTLNEPIVNYMAVSPTKSLFLEAVHTEDQPHDAEWLAADLIRVMDGIGDNAVGCVTDNTAANKKALKELEQKYPNRFFHGCVCHGLNLLVKDIFGAKKKIPEGGGPAQYPDGYPFEDLLLFTADCKDIVSFFHNHHAPMANLQKALKSSKLKGLVRPAPTRWGTIQDCFKSLRAADNVLNGLVSQRDFVSTGNANQKEKRTAINTIITDPDFVTKLDECIKILEPIDMFIKVFQSDAVPCSDVYNAFLDPENKMNGLTNINAEKKAYLVKQVKKRFDFMYGDAHGMAYLLDPRYLGDKMSRALRKEIEDFIFNFPTADGSTCEERKQKLAEEYTAFRIDALQEREKNGFCFKMIGKSKTVLQWWMADGTDWPLLQNLALRVFAMAASSAASERNFSTFGFIHSKLRDRLTPEKVMKLVYIKANTLQMSDKLCESYECAEDDEELETMEIDED